MKAFRVYRAAGRPPIAALANAREDVARGRAPWVYRGKTHLGHGDVLRAAGRTFVIAIVRDDDMGPPWEEHDGHGPVSDWTSRDKRPGERELSSDRGSRRFYDWEEATRIAKADRWGLAPDVRAALALQLGREPTAKQVVAEAVRRDFERLSGWANDQWEWCGVCLFELPRDGVTRDPSRIADQAPFGELEHWALWGIESDSPEYHAEVAAELLSDAIATRH